MVEESKSERCEDSLKYALGLREETSSQRTHSEGVGDGIDESRCERSRWHSTRRVAPGSNADDTTVRSDDLFHLRRTRAFACLSTPR